MRGFVCVLVLLASTAWAADAPALRIVGQVKQEQALSLADIQGLPAKTISVTFHTMHGEEHHAWTGVLLIDLIGKAGLLNESGKNAELRHALMVHGKDGYIVAVAYGEIDPIAANEQILLAYRRDDDALSGLRLVMPADAGGARQVKDVTEIEVK